LALAPKKMLQEVKDFSKEKKMRNKSCLAKIDTVNDIITLKKFPHPTKKKSKEKTKASSPFFSPHNKERKNRYNQPRFTVINILYHLSFIILTQQRKEE
jgi:hypothetical protein